MALLCGARFRGLLRSFPLGVCNRPSAGAQCSRCGVGLRSLYIPPPKLPDFFSLSCGMGCGLAGVHWYMTEEVNQAEYDKVMSGINDCPNDCLCSNKIEPDYKNVRLLSQFVSSQTGMIIPRNITKICMKKQRRIAKAIKRSRAMGFMPYVNKLPRHLKDPKLF